MNGKELLSLLNRMPNDWLEYPVTDAGGAEVETVEPDKVGGYNCLVVK